MALRPTCERCGVALRGTDEAYVCSWDCTFCPRCAPGPERVCPNCGGELVRRPRRAEPPPPTEAEDRGTGDLAPASEVRLRRATPDDLDELAPLFDAYRQFYRHPPDAARSRAFLAERLGRGESVVFLAHRGPLAVGFVQLYPMFSSTTVRRLWVLNDLYVVPDARRQGVGALLLARAQELARASDADAVVLETAVDNPAQRLYEALGWKRDRQFLHYEWHPP
jgi:ribosomal protein S18 acetylase RimI-like enzyme